MREAQIVDTWLAGTLKADGTLASLMGGTVRAYADLAPTSAALPVIVWSTQSDVPVNTQNGVRIMVDSTYLVKVIGQVSSYSTLQPIANRIDELLHLSTGANVAGLVMSCVQVEQVKYAEIASGQPYRHLGGQYRIHAKAL